MGERADMAPDDSGTDSTSILESISYSDAALPDHRNITLAECVGKLHFASPTLSWNASLI